MAYLQMMFKAQDFPHFKILAQAHAVPQLTSAALFAVDKWLDTHLYFVMLYTTICYICSLDAITGNFASRTTAACCAIRAHILPAAATENKVKRPTRQY